MDTNQIDIILQSQKKFFLEGNTLPVSFRISMLKKLRESILRHSDEINNALRIDLGKSNFEGYMCEIGMVMGELSYMIRHTKSLAKEKRVHTPLHEFVSRSFKKPSPYGNVLIMSPWNYPFLLTVGPLIDAIAAGNTAIVKPSAYSPATSKVISDILDEAFNTNYIAVVTGGRKENSFLLEKKFDMFFFTGSQAVGKEVMRHAAEHLTPVVLELGGKSPCIVDETANIKLAAKRIVFGKYLNCGQTCVAPDYILCHKSVKDKFVKEVKNQIIEQFGENPLENADYGKIINEKHFNRLLGLIDENKLVFGGQTDPEACRISPSVLDNVTWDDEVMGQEIFGPIMPILTFDSLEDVITTVQEHQKPLALYMFSSCKKNIKAVTSRCSFGGGCINDTIIHLATSEMGFGGVGESGMGSYHGKDGFNAFSHTKSIVDKKTWLDLPMRYQPYKKLNDKLIHMFLK